MKVVFQFKKEGKYSEVDEGATRSQLIKKFHSLFKDRSGSILQYKISCGNEPVWINFEENFKLTNSIQVLRIIQDKEKKLRLGNLDPLTSLVFCCDMQERFKPAIKYFDEIVVVGSRILKAAELLNIPVVVTEQYPRGLGKTVAELNIGDKCFKAEKTKFSMVTPSVEEHLDKFPNAKSVVIFGVEAHVCVQQTVSDLTKLGFDVHIVADATSSRSLSDKHLAFERFKRMGAFVTSCETVLLQWVADKQHEQFKPMQNLIKELPPSTGLAVKSSM